MGGGIKRGAFINTARASCSIHESGLMVYSCLKGGLNYELDYFSTDMIDLAALRDEGVVRLNHEGAGIVQPSDHYDFWVFNWHFYTMAADLDPAVIAALKGPKFTVVLELAPGDPLKLVPADVFDAYIALDPGAVATDTIYPFPRPLDGEPNTTVRPAREVPVIGSFGFATPGKGFETIVEAVNREFDEAIVRINIPAGDHIGTGIVHGCDYARYLEQMCKRIAKPGVEVRFSYDFLTSEQLVDWCGENDLNCFMYTRCQPGLSATTDQAIISGRPLLTSSNDTFRHIHQYIPPYPVTSMKQAIERTVPQVHALQHDWSVDTFNARFAQMLADFGVLDESQIPASTGRIGMAGFHEILVASATDDAGGMLDRPRRMADALGRSGQYVTRSVHSANIESIAREIAHGLFDAVILSGFSQSDANRLADASPTFKGPILVLQGADSAKANEDANSRTVSVTAMPVVPYFTISDPLGEIATIWLLGFSTDLEALGAMLRRVTEEIRDVRVCVQILPDMSAKDVAAINALFATIDGLRAETHLPAPTGEGAIHTYAAAKLVVVRNAVGYTDFIQNQAELAMITERAVVFSREAFFPTFAGHETFVEDIKLSDAVELGVGAQIRILGSFIEGAAFDRLHGILAPALSGVSLRQREGGGEAVVTNDQRFINRIFWTHLGRAPDAAGLDHYLGRLAAGVSQRKIERDVRRSDEAKRHHVLQGSRVAQERNVRSLLDLDDEAFVRAGYVELLGRQPDPAGLSHHRNLLQIGETKAAILVGLASSSEGRSFASDLPGLEALIRRQKRSRFWGRLLKPESGQAALERSLGIVEHRLAMLKQHVDQERDKQYDIQQEFERRSAEMQAEFEKGAARMFDAAEAASSQAISQFVPALAESAREDVAALVTFARHVPGTVHILVGRTDRPLAHISSYLRQLVGSWLNTGGAIRLVEWDPYGRRLRFAARETLTQGPWRDLPGLPVSEHPPRNAAGIELGSGSVEEMDWLLVGDTLRSSVDVELTLEVDLILEARRIGLNNAFVFHGAGALRDPQASPQAVACQDQYMQALLLADCLIAECDVGIHELEHYLSVSQCAAFGPPRFLLPMPMTEDLVVWRAHVDSVQATLQSARSEAPFVRLHFINERGGSQASVLEREKMARAFEEIGIEVCHLPASPDRGAVLPKTANGKTNWLVLPLAASLPELARAIDVGVESGLLVALVVGAEALPHDPEMKSQLAACLCRAEKIICTDEVVSSWVWQTLLATRSKFPSADDRIIVIKPKLAGDVDGYAQRIARSLAQHFPAKRGVSITSKAAHTARDLMPRLRARPKISLCISTYNRAKWLNTSLDNIFRQIPESREDLEVLVVDNCSQDDTPLVREKYAHRQDFRFIRNPVNVGMLGNLAVTAQRARGEYIWILGDDDLTRNGVILKIIDILNNNQNLELIYMNYGYTSEPTPDSVTDLDRFLDEFNVLQPACADEMSTGAKIAAKTENFYTAIYSHVYRRDHGMRSYCQDTSGRTFATMRACIPTAYYVLHYMMESPAYWIGEQALVVNSNVSWAAYGPMLDLEHLPASWDLAERGGCPTEEVEMRRANRLWLVEMMWRDIFENDTVGNGAYVSPARVIMRLCHLPDFEKHVPEFRRIYAAAHKAGAPLASLAPDILFGAF